MDKRNWLWKKKSSDKQAAEKTYISASDSSATTAHDIAPDQVNKGKQDSVNKGPKYIQISIESYTHLTGLEDLLKSREEKVQTLEGEVKKLNEKLSEAHSEMINKENLVKQHAKVAEEAVSGWEKVETEAAMLKNQLESVSLLKLTAEDRASHLDGALKECTRQIRNLKEEHDQKLHEVNVDKKKLFEKMKLEHETQVMNLDQEIRRSAAESAALSRSLQEHSNMLIKLGEEKSQAEARIENLKSKIESCEKEVNSLKYELHITKKEVEIRNEEKNISVRSAEVANKKHAEVVKKIAKLESECQRLRGLVRKKLPGPAALAQMKLEVENFGQDYGEPHQRRSPRPPTSHVSQLPGFSFGNLTKYQKENELLSERLLAMGEETRMLKEALSDQNNELQASRSLCTQMVGKLQSLEAQLQVNDEQTHPLTCNAQVLIEGFSNKKATNPPRFTIIAEDGNDDNVSCAGSCATVSMSELSYIEKEKNVDGLHKSGSTNQQDLMDDFLEMEKLAYLSSGSNGLVSSSDVSGNRGNKESELVKHETSLEDTTSTNSHFGDEHSLELLMSSKDDAAVSHPPLQDPLIFAKLQSKISAVLESISNEKDMDEVIVHVRGVMLDMLDSLPYQSINGVVEAAHCSGAARDLQSLADDAKITKKELSLSGDVNSGIEAVGSINKKLEIAISNIYDFVMILGKEAKAVPGLSPDGVGLSKGFSMIAAKYSEAIKSKINLIDFVLDISHVLHEVRELQINVLGSKNSEVETATSDYIDKIVLPENKAVKDSSKESYPNGSGHCSDSASDHDIPNGGDILPTSESTATSRKCSLEEFEKLKMDKDKLAIDLARRTESFESTKSQLMETEQILTEVKSQLTSAQKANSLAETQLKCMAESYKSLETRAEELQAEINLLQGKIENLEIELQEERRSHQEALTRCNDLMQKLQRIDSCAGADNDDKNSQEQLAAAAEKLAECQETVYLLGKQLKSLRPQADFLTPPNNEISQKVEVSIEEEEPIVSGENLQDTDPPGMDTTSSFNMHRAGSESPFDLCSTPFGPSDSEANSPLRSPVFGSKRLKHRPTKSGSSSTSTPTRDKQSRGFIRFFSSKGKNAH